MDQLWQLLTVNDDQVLGFNKNSVTSVGYLLPGESRSWELPKEADIVWQVFISIWVELNINIFLKYSISVPNKLTETTVCWGLWIQ